jgi:hypothetical protein
MVELQIVVLVVAGSSPVGHPPSPAQRCYGVAGPSFANPKFQIPSSKLAGLVFRFWNLGFEISAVAAVWHGHC